MSGEEKRGDGPEFEVLVRAARAAVDSARPFAVQDLLKRGVDSARLLRLAAWHRVLTILQREIEINGTPIPADLRQGLADARTANAARNAVRAAELCRICSRFESRGIQALAFRGPLLAEELYGDLALRHFSDLDLLVKPDDAARATEALVEEGYEPQFRLDARQQAAFLHFRGERFFIRPSEQLCVDLHWRILPDGFDFEPAESSFFAAARRVTVGDAAVKTLSTRDLGLFLCLHGSKHGWNRLGYVSDLARWAVVHRGTDWLDLRARAARRGQERMVDTGLGLAERLLGAPVPVSLADAAEVRATVDEAIERLQRAGEGAEKEWSLVLRLYRGSGRKAAYLADLVLVPSGIEIEKISLSRRFFWIYYLIRAVRLTWRHSLGRWPGSKR